MTRAPKFLCCFCFIYFYYKFGAFAIDSDDFFDFLFEVLTLYLLIYLCFFTLYRVLQNLAPALPPPKYNDIFYPSATKCLNPPQNQGSQNLLCLGPLKFWPCILIFSIQIIVIRYTNVSE